MLLHGRDQGLGMGRAKAVVDVPAVGTAADGHHLGPQLVQHGRCNLVGRAVGGIDDDLQPAQGEAGVDRALAELDVAPLRIADTPGLAQAGGVGPGGRLGQRGLDGQLPRVGQLAALGRKELDAVVRIGVVRGTEHHAQVQPERAGQVGHAGRGQRAAQQHVDAGRGKAGFQRRFEHVAGNARVLADQHGRAAPTAAALGLQHATHRMAQAQHEVGRDRGLAHGAADAVGAEILSAHAGIVAAGVQPAFGDRGRARLRPADRRQPRP